MTDPRPVCTEKTQDIIKTLRSNVQVEAALELAVKQQEKRIADQIILTETPAPPFHEEERAKVLLGMFKQYGLTDVKQDAIGNVIGRRKGTGNGPTLVVGAHIDTVFPAGTDCKVHRDGDVYSAPGISDDAAGLASMLQVIRCLNENNIETVGDIVFVGTLGEEGNGDLRGCKRFRIIFEGPGGHSLHKFGIVGSAIHGLSRAIVRVDELKVPTDPKCTFNFGVIKGGTSVNAIAARAEAELDIRSFNQPALEAFVKTVLETIEAACDEENMRWGLEGDGMVSLKIEQIGDRPAGMNADDASVIQAAYGSLLSLGISLDKYTLAATDQNVPLFYGLPATTLGAGGTEENNHALSERWNAKDAFQGPQVAFLTALTLVGMKGVSEPILEKVQH